MLQSTSLPAGSKKFTGSTVLAHPIIYCQIHIPSLLHNYSYFQKQKQNFRKLIQQDPEELLKTIYPLLHFMQSFVTEMKYEIKRFLWSLLIGFIHF